ncbi:MAG: alkaline phosphatase family protein [Isosphaeraceae bacterium]
MRPIRLLLLGLFVMTTLIQADEDVTVVGEASDGRVIVPTNQVLTPAGKVVTFPGRPTDLALLPDGKTVAVKNLRDLIVLDAEAGTIVQTLKLPSGGHAVSGLIVAEDGKTIYTSGTGSKIHVAHRDQPDDPFQWAESWTLPAPKVGGDPAPTGLALTEDGKQVLALSGRGNTLWRLDRETGKAIGEAVQVGVAPFGVVIAGTRAYVSNWGGDPPKDDDPQAPSSKTRVKIDPKTGASASGSVSVVDLTTGKVLKAIATGLHPTGLTTDNEGRFVYVACANSDTVEVIDTAKDVVVESIEVRPEARLPFGSGPNALALSNDGARLFVANGTNNAVAVIALSNRLRKGGAEPAKPSQVLGFIPVGWYPGAVIERQDGSLVVANIKGQGSRNKTPDKAFNSHDHLGSVCVIPHFNDDALAKFTQQVSENNRQSRARSGLEPPGADVPPRPVPERHGEPSVFKHVIYIIKENRTYDQVFGDMKQGNGDESLCLFGREVTPNQHAMAEEFVLLDNFYCAGVLSADGHAWATEAYATDYLERHFGGFVRSYPYDGDDPLAYASSGFLWDNALAHGRTFRNYGEFVKATITPKTAKWKDLYADYLNDTKTVKIVPRATIATLTPYTCPNYIGFPGTVPDVYRAKEFLKEFKEFEANGDLPNLIIMLLPNNHTAGTRPDLPTPRAMVADNDLALGRIVEAVSHSKYWPETVIFVCEDDPQAGLDHVDGHRTVAQAISPYTRRGMVDHGFYSQVGLVKTMELILGLPPMNQMDLAAPAMRGCFQDEADLRPYTAKPNIVPLDEMNPSLSQLSGKALHWAQVSLELDLDDVDDAPEDTFNRIIWHAVKGVDVPYPAVARAEDDDED